MVRAGSTGRGQINNRGQSAHEATRFVDWIDLPRRGGRNSPLATRFQRRRRRGCFPGRPGAQKGRDRDLGAARTRPILPQWADLLVVRNGELCQLARAAGARRSADGLTIEASLRVRPTSIGDDGVNRRLVERLRVGDGPSLPAACAAAIGEVGRHFGYPREEGRKSRRSPTANRAA